LSKTSASFSETSKKIDDVMDKAGGTMDSAKGAAQKFELAADDARKTIQAAGRVMSQATSGNGLLAVLLTNQEVAQNLRALIANLRSHGVLFYRDSAAKTSPPAQSTSPPPRRQPR